MSPLADTTLVLNHWQQTGTEEKQPIGESDFYLLVS